jgi:hypothetical protein
MAAKIQPHGHMSRRIIEVVPRGTNKENYFNNILLNVALFLWRTYVQKK